MPAKAGEKVTVRQKHLDGKKKRVEEGMSERLRTIGTQPVACELPGPFP